MNLKPLNDNIIIKPIVNDMTAGGLIIPDSAKEKSQYGVVVAFNRENKLALSVGEKVLFSKYAGTEIKHESEDVLIIKEQNILAVEEKTEVSF